MSGNILNYKNEWKLLERKNLSSDLMCLPDCLEKEHLYEIGEMLKKENFVPEQFWVSEYPSQGIYYIEKISDKSGEEYFCIVESNGELIPHYTTINFDENGLNTFGCKTIKESIQLMEC